MNSGGNLLEVVENFAEIITFDHFEWNIGENKICVLNRARMYTSWSVKISDFSND